MIAVAHPLFGREEEAAVLQVLASGQLVQGAGVATFERRFADLCQVEEAIAVTSGTAALHLTLLAHDIGQGDEVITTPFSFAASANVILLVGATPVFVDIEADTYTLNPDLVEAAITPRTKAILPVHLYGHPCAMERLVSIARAHGLVLIEDACQAHAAAINGRSVGSFGTGAFSFYATKNMTTGEGGMITTNDPAIAERVRLLRNHGQTARYHHMALGYNQRMTELQAALGLVQLQKLEQLTEQRIANAAYLTERLSNIVQTPVTRPGYRHVYHQYTIRVPGDRRCDLRGTRQAVAPTAPPGDRDEWVRRLGERGIGTAVHYPLPIHRQPCYQDVPWQFRVASQHENLPVAETAAQQVLSLPVHPGLRQADLTAIVEEVRRLCV